MSRRALFAVGGLGLIVGGVLLARARKERPVRVSAALAGSPTVIEKWRALGGEKRVGKPASPLLILPGGVVAQRFLRADGDKQTIYASRAGAFVVRGGFHGLYVGREDIFGLPTSDEYNRTLGGAATLGNTVETREQTFERGRMVWYKAANRVVGYADRDVPTLAGKLQRARVKVYDSKPPKTRRAWYEDIGLGDVAMAALAPTTLMNVGITILVGSGVEEAALNFAIPGLATPVLQARRLLDTYTCKGAAGINSATGTGSPQGNALCREYQKNTKAKTDPLKLAKAGASAYAQNGSGGAVPAEE